MSDKLKERQEMLTDAAIAVFARYGVKRTTMADVASAAGVSRQTLYAAFPNKDELFFAAVERFTQVELARVKAGWSMTTELSEQLELFFERLVIVPFEMMQKSPDSADLMMAKTDGAKAAMRKCAALKADVLASVLMPHEAAIVSRGQTVGDVAGFVYASASGYKIAAADRPELDRLLASLKAAVLGMVQR